MIIVCDHHAWTIEAKTAVYPLTPAGSFLATTAKIPAQRDGDHAKHEQPSQFVWKIMCPRGDLNPHTLYGY